MSLHSVCVSAVAEQGGIAAGAKYIYGRAYWCSRNTLVCKIAVPVKATPPLLRHYVCVCFACVFVCVLRNVIEVCAKDSMLELRYNTIIYKQQQINLPK